MLFELSIMDEIKSPLINDGTYFETSQLALPHYLGNTYGGYANSTFNSVVVPSYNSLNSTTLKLGALNTVNSLFGKFNINDTTNRYKSIIDSSIYFTPTGSWLATALQNLDSSIDINKINPFLRNDLLGSTLRTLPSAINSLMNFDGTSNPIEEIATQFATQVAIQKTLPYLSQYTNAISSNITKIGTGIINDYKVPNDSLSKISSHYQDPESYKNMINKQPSLFQEFGKSIRPARAAMYANMGLDLLSGIGSLVNEYRDRASQYSQMLPTIGQKFTQLRNVTLEETQVSQRNRMELSSSIAEIQQYTSSVAYTGDRNNMKYPR